jgi:hypothetical protein
MIAPGNLETQEVRHAPCPVLAPEVQALLDKGEAARKAYRWEEALRLFQEAREKAHALQDPAGEALALHEAAYVCQTTSQPQKAAERELDTFTDALQAKYPGLKEQRAANTL